jgi:hypothetical protein
MLAEVVIHLGQEWRDLAYCLFGMSLGVFGGIVIQIERGKKKKCPMCNTPIHASVLNVSDHHSPN